MNRAEVLTRDRAMSCRARGICEPLSYSECACSYFSSGRESQLLLKISEGLPPDIWKAYGELRAKKERGELTPDDEAHVAAVVDRLENHMADRVRWLGELAGLRNQSVTELMATLELESHHD